MSSLRLRPFAVVIVTAAMTLLALAPTVDFVPGGLAKSAAGSDQPEGPTASPLSVQKSMLDPPSAGPGLPASDVPAAGADRGSTSPVGKAPADELTVRPGGLSAAVIRSEPLTVPVGNDPTALALDTMNGDIYVVNSLSNDVSIIAVSSNTVVGTVNVGKSPDAVAVDTVNGDVYIANTASDNVSVISGASNALIQTIPVGSGPAFLPYGLVVDGATDTVYVANFGSATVTVISGSTNTAVETIPVGMNPVALAVDLLSGNVYVANFGSSNVSEINGTTNKVVATIPVSADPRDLAADSINGCIYVAGTGGENDPGT